MEKEVKIIDEPTEKLDNKIKTSPMETERIRLQKS